MLKIEIDAQDIIQSRVFKGRDGKPDRTNYWQNGYMYNGGRFPVLIEIPLEEGQSAYVAGDYEIHPSNFQASKYNKMELNPFKLILVPFQLAEKKKVI